VRRAVLAIAVAAPAALAAPRAAAEEGLFVLRAGGGVTEPHLDQAWTVSGDLTIGDRGGVIGRATLRPHDGSTVLALGLGAKYVVAEGMWRRLYVDLTPELLVVWPDGRSATWDVAAGGTLGFEQLFMWGFGVQVEVHGTLPAGRGPGDPLEPASASATAGLFMEF